jgi:hypothetical protein
VHALKFFRSTSGKSFGTGIACDLGANRSLKLGISRSRNSRHMKALSDSANNFALKALHLLASSFKTRVNVGHYDEIASEVCRLRPRMRRPESRSNEYRNLPMQPQ